MDMPKQEIEVVSNTNGELVLKTSVTRTPDDPNVYFKYDPSIKLCNDDIAALVYFFSGRNQEVEIKDFAITSSMKKTLDASFKHVVMNCAIDDNLPVKPTPKLESLDKEKIKPGVIFSGGFDSMAVHNLTKEVFGEHELLFGQYGEGYEREYEYAKKFNPRVFETNWRKKVPAAVRPISPFNFPMIVNKYVSDSNCYFKGNTLEAIMFYRSMGDKILARDDFKVNIFEPIGSLFEPSVIWLVSEYLSVDEMFRCVDSVANPRSEKMRRKKMMINIVMDKKGIKHERFTIDKPPSRCDTMKVEHGLITVLYLLKHLPREQVELVYDLSEVPAEVFDVVKNYKLTFFDRYNPLYLDDMAEKYFTPIFEKHGIQKYDDNDIKEDKSILQMIQRFKDEAKAAKQAAKKAAEKPIEVKAKGPKKRFKHVVLVKFLSKKMNLTNILEDEMIDYRLKFLGGNLFPTLNNQTNKDFELVLLTNPELKVGQAARIKKVAEGIPHEFGFRTLTHDSALENYLAQTWAENEFVAVSRLDDDDFIERDCVKQVHDYSASLVPGKPEQVHVLGYGKGYLYVDWLQQLATIDFGYGKAGHVSIFQTFVYDTTQMAFNPKIMPFPIGNEIPKKALNAQGCVAKCVSLDSDNEPPKVVFFVHERSDSLFRANAKKHKPNIEPLEMSPELMADLATKFGFAPKYEKPSRSRATNVNLTWTQVQPNAMYGRIGVNATNFSRIDLKCAPARQSMADALATSQGMYLVFSTKSEEIALKCKMTCDAANVAMLGLDQYGVWNVMRVEVESYGEERQFTVKNDREYVKFQACFPQSTISEIQVGATNAVEFEKPGKCDIVFVGSGIAQNACNSVHMNICPYLYRKFGLNCAEASIAGFHTFMCEELVDALAKKSIPIIAMDVFNVDKGIYAKGKAKLRHLVPAIVYLDDNGVDEVIQGNGLGRNDLVVLPAECMFDSRRLNDYGTVFYCGKLIERGLVEERNNEIHS